MFVYVVSQEAVSKAEDEKRTDYKAGRAVGLSGREMFSFDPALAAHDDDGDEAVDLATYEREDDEEHYRELQLADIGIEATEVSIYYYYY